MRRESYGKNVDEEGKYLWVVEEGFIHREQIYLRQNRKT